MPNHLQNVMRSQGIEGPSYKFLHGNTKEILDMRMKSMGRPMDHLSHEIFPRIMPHVHSWVSLYGRNFLNWYGPQGQLVVTEAELIKEIMNNKDGVYPKIELEGHAKKLLGDGLSSTKGDKWTKLRKIANGVFHGESLKSMIPVMITSTETMLQRWKEHNEQELEVFEEFRVLTSEVISKTAFGSSYLEGKKIFDMLMKLAMIVARNAHKIRLPVISKLIKNNDDIESDKLEQGIKDCIVEIIRKRDQEKSMDMGINDFLGTLLETSRDKDELKRITLDDMVDECKTFYFAGHETTTSFLGWTILLLATHQEWQEKARKEVFDVFAKANPNQDSITRLKIMNMIIEESLRLYPPVPALKRRVKREVQLGKMTLPPNLELYIPILAVHHDPRIWGEDVRDFKPDRFEGGIAKATNNTLAAYFPFGFGPRTCVGLNFAMLEAKIVLAMILQRYKFKLSPNYVHSPVQLFMYRNLRIVLTAEDKLTFLEQPMFAAPVPPEGLNRAFTACKPKRGRLVSSYVLQMKSYIDHLNNYNMHGMGKTVNELHAMLKLHEETFPKKYVAPALHAIRAGRIQKNNNKNKKSLKATKGKNQGKGKTKLAYAPNPKVPPPPKKDNPAKDAICHQCGEVGHWRRNSP
ncbi:cytochrome P450 CYP749A22-like protein [Tanacetum coccineum]